MLINYRRRDTDLRSYTPAETFSPVRDTSCLRFTINQIGVFAETHEYLGSRLVEGFPENSLFFKPMYKNNRELYVRDFLKMELLVSKKGKKQEAANGDIIVIPQLRKMTLQGLGNFKSSCTEAQLFFDNKVLFPIIASQLEDAANAHDVLKIKACLFAICTSFVISGTDSMVLPERLVSKAICQKAERGNAVMGDSVVSCVINKLTNDKIELYSTKMGNEGCPYELSISVSFRMCMANVLISACQKMPNSGKKTFAWKVLPHLIQSMGMIMESDIRAAFVQVFFSAVYHLKSAVLSLCIRTSQSLFESLTDGSDKD